MCESGKKLVKITVKSKVKPTFSALPTEVSLCGVNVELVLVPVVVGSGYHVLALQLLLGRALRDPSGGFQWILYCKEIVREPASQRATRSCRAQHVFCTVGHLLSDAGS